MHRLHCIKIHPDSLGSAVVLGGIRRQNIAANGDKRAEATSGSLFATHTAVVGQKFVDTFDTLHVGQALAIFGLIGLLIRNTTNPGLVAYFAKQDGQGILSGSVHRSFTMGNGLIVPERLSVDHQGDAVLSLKMLATWNGNLANYPVVIADNVALPTQTTVEERFSMGPLVLGGNTYTGLRNIDLNFGNNAETVGSGGDIWDTQSRISETMPTLSLRGIDTEWVKDSKIPIGSACATHANSYFVLRKRKKCGGYWVDAAETEHIKISLDGLVHADELVDAQGNALGQSNVSITTKYDGTNAPIIITTDTDY